MHPYDRQMSLPEFVYWASLCGEAHRTLADNAAMVILDMRAAGFTQFTVYGSFVTAKECPKDIDLLVGPANRIHFLSGKYVHDLRNKCMHVRPEWWDWTTKITRDGRTMTKLEAQLGVDVIFDFGVMPNAPMTYQARARISDDGGYQGVIQIVEPAQEVTDATTR
jgi:hypothetical protein